LRRGTALFFATLVLWGLTLTTNTSAAANRFHALAASPAFVETVLRTELGDVSSAPSLVDGMEQWQRLILSQSPTLLAGEDQVAARLGGQADTEPEQPAASPSTEPDDPDDPQQLPETDASSKVVSRTLLPTDSSAYSTSGDIYIQNRPGLDLDVAALAAAPVTLELPDEGPEILIMHTHGTEAYTPDGDDQYTPSGDSRTTDLNYSVVRVGDEMERIFTEMGLRVVHDRTLYDYPEYNGCYDRSMAAVEQYLTQYPSIRVVLDVHRDALIGSDGTVYKPVTTINGAQCAQIMLVMGSDAAGLAHPNWRKNLSLAIHVQEECNTLWPTLARPISLGSHRYNQQLSAGSMLVEVGSNGNTLQEALASARYFARAVGVVLLKH
jgi:stage II sporulation protein P